MMMMITIWLHPPFFSIQLPHLGHWYKQIKINYWSNIILHWTICCRFWEVEVDFGGCQSRYFHDIIHVLHSLFDVNEIFWLTSTKNLLCCNSKLHCFYLYVVYHESNCCMAVHPTYIFGVSCDVVRCFRIIFTFC